ncbi:MAG: hypothetical protein PHS82_03150 [Lachnospiraceae bacterium]|nr:hypothetical protein [Lachnospiraceae bacterium]
MARLGNREVKVLRKHENSIIGVRVELTRKTTISGKIIYAVIVTNMKTGRHYVVKPFDGIMSAYQMYKDAVA